MRYQRNLYTAEKYILWATILLVTLRLSSFVYLLLPPKFAKSRENPIKFDLIQQFKVIQGHRSWYQWKAHV